MRASAQAVGWRLVGCGVFVCLLAGCGAKDRTTNSSGETESGPKRIATEKLLALLNEGPLPPLDGGRIEITPPKGWNTFARSDKFVTGFYKDKSSTLPRIVIKATDLSGDLQTVTEANLDEFMLALKAHLLQENASYEKTLLEPLKAMIIGGKPCIRYVVSVTHKEYPAEQQVLQTLHEGRLYTFTLDVEKDHLKSKTQYRDTAYAVVAGVKFGAGSSGAAENAAPAAVEPPAVPAPEKDQAAEKDKSAAPGEPAK